MASPSPQPSPMPPPQALSPMGHSQASSSPSGMIPPPTSQTMGPIHHPHSPTGYSQGPHPGMMNHINGPTVSGSTVTGQGNQSFPPHTTGPLSGLPHSQQPGSPQENLNAIQRAIDSMEEKGMQEDPRYSQLIALRNRQGNMEPPRPPHMQVHHFLFKNLLIYTLFVYF